MKLFFYRSENRLCILNKVASSNFDTLLEKIRVEFLNIDTQERLACVAEMLYEKVY